MPAWRWQNPKVLRGASGICCVWFTVSHTAFLRPASSPRSYAQRSYRIRRSSQVACGHNLSSPSDGITPSRGADDAGLTCDGAPGRHDRWPSYMLVVPTSTGSCLLSGSIRLR